MVRVKKRYKLLLVIAWIVLVCYPNPTHLAVTILRSLDPPIDPVAVGSISAEMPDDPRQIESLILTEHVPYAYDWTVFEMPWYFPTPDEVVRHGRGDCEARAVVLASVLEAKGIPYEFNVSPTHIWVKYQGKIENSVETEAVAFVEHKDGAYRVKLPEQFDFSETLRIEIDSLWTAMPVARKVLLLFGIVLALVVDALASPIVAWHRRRRSIPVTIHQN